MRPIDVFRCRALAQLSAVESFQNSWVKWQPEIEKILGPAPNSQKIFELGSELSRIYALNSVGGRSQESLSGGGTAWECLVQWYLNLVLWGTNVVAVRQNRKFVPQCVMNALCVTLSNHKANTESDIVVFSVPHSVKEPDSLKDIDALIRENIKDTDLTVVQCKTNWNDNAQIPMLWDLLYNSEKLRITQVKVGSEGFAPTSFRKFSYAFVTVPSNRKTEHKADSLAVQRVTLLTGGNYWGQKSKAGVAQSLSEFFGKNFSSAFTAGVQNHIRDHILKDPVALGNFINLGFEQKQQPIKVADLFS